MQLKCKVCGSTRRIWNFKGKIPLCNKHYKQMYRHGKTFRTRFDPNEIILHDDYAEVKIYDKDGKEKDRTIIDKEDIEIIKKYKWYTNQLNYVRSDSNNSRTLLHRLVKKCPEYKVVDHINGDPLDNRKANLRICTQQENTFNKRHRIDVKSGHTGVVYRKRERKWFAYISRDGKQHSLGYHDTKEQAIRARKQGEIKYFGKYRRSEANG